MKHRAPASSPRGRRRPYVWHLARGLVALLLFSAEPAPAERQYVVAFANLTEEPGVTVEGTGFTGRDIRESFALAARAHPVEMVYYDNQRDDARALQNADAAIARKVDLYIQYHQGNLSATADRVPERARGVTDALAQRLPAVRVAALDTKGNPAQVGPLLGKFLAAHPTGKLLLAATDDTTALAVKSAVEAAGRAHDTAIVSHGVDRTIHGGMNDRKEIDPNNRGSIVIGSVAFYLDRYGYEVLPIAMRMLRGETVPARATTRHILVTAANVFLEYPPYDMN